MNFVDEQLERNISYHLDGELDADSQVELYRNLLRDPDARQMLDAYQETDAAAGDALRELLGSPRPVPLEVIQPKRRRQIPWGQMLATAACLALAAGVAALVQIAWPALEADTTDGPLAGGPTIATSPGDAPLPEQQVTNDQTSPALTDAAPGSAGWWRRSPAPAVQDGRLVDASLGNSLMEGPRQAQRVTDKSVVGVYSGDGQTVYLIEVDRQRTQVESMAGEL
jgi:hypothetical protein